MKNRRTIRRVFDGVIVTNNRYDEKDDFGEGDLGTSYDAVAFGRAFLANPDLPARCVWIIVTCLLVPYLFVRVLVGAWCFVVKHGLRGMRVIYRIDLYFCLFFCFSSARCRRGLTGFPSLALFACPSTARWKVSMETDLNTDTRAASKCL